MRARTTHLTASGCLSMIFLTASLGGGCGAPSGDWPARPSEPDNGKVTQGSVSFRTGGRALELSALSSCSMVWLDVKAPREADGASVTWSMEIYAEEAGTFACAHDDRAGLLGIFFTDPTNGARYGTLADTASCTLQIDERRPRFKASFQATLANRDDPAQPPMVLEGGAIDLPVPSGSCY